MNEIRQRLVRCFQAVFPDLTEVDVLRASASRVSGWDSVATVTLVAAVEEEFSLQVDPQEIEKLTSFQVFLDKVEKQ